MRRRFRGPAPSASLPSFSSCRGDSVGPSEVTVSDEGGAKAERRRLDE